MPRIDAAWIKMVKFYQKATTTIARIGQGDKAYKKRLSIGGIKDEDEQES